jgi:pimeloyl-ACP methyl ester carboxylesterase
MAGVTPGDSSAAERPAFDELDVELSDGRLLHAYALPDAGNGSLAVVWHHGTPNIGAPPRPLFADAQRLGIRWVSYDRPGYGGSTPHAERDVASAAADVSSVADALGLEEFAVMGHSGGGAHALACSALLADRVRGVVSVAGLAPYGAEGLDWYGGMAPGGVASLQAAARGRAAKERHEASDAEGDIGFTTADENALEGDWSWLIDVVGPALEAGPGGLIDDDLAAVRPWGFDPAGIVAPTLLLHGGEDRVVPSSHGEWLAQRCPPAQLWLSPRDGHISILNCAAAALEWLRQRVDEG